MGTKVKTAPPETITVTGSDCRHHWIIESPHGPISKGVCKICGEEKEFQNFMPDMSWDGDQSSLFGISRARDNRSGKESSDNY